MWNIVLCCDIMLWGEDENWLFCFMLVCYECLLFLFVNYDIFLCWFWVYFSDIVCLFSCVFFVLSKIFKIYCLYVYLLFFFFDISLKICDIILLVWGIDR